MLKSLFGDLGPAEDPRLRAATAIVHAPYYGTTGSGTPGLGSSRADFEAYASQTLGASGPNASSRTNGLFCFVLPLAAGSFGVTYNSEMPPKVSAIVLGQCM